MSSYRAGRAYLATLEADGRDPSAEQARLKASVERKRGELEAAAEQIQAGLTASAEMLELPSFDEIFEQLFRTEDPAQGTDPAPARDVVIDAGAKEARTKKHVGRGGGRAAVLSALEGMISGEEWGKLDTDIAKRAGVDPSTVWRLKTRDGGIKRLYAAYRRGTISARPPRFDEV